MVVYICLSIIKQKIPNSKNSIPTIVPENKMFITIEYKKYKF